ncbi:MAG: CCA tRNA nucleotidyltransferase [Phycisphaerae bacterium]|nr:CCA tRNA nucleotidyltransferase [Phycisphaerae bacterium]
MPRAHDPELARLAAANVVAALRARGHAAYFAGGCVRDLLLGLRPTDFDVATDAPPARVRELFRSTSEVGAAFGVVLVRLDGCAIEVATFRSDGPYSDARRPDAVTFSDARGDAQRRDFTINALFLDPERWHGVARGDLGDGVIDYVGGLNDLRARVVRAVGDPHARLAEDHLRALRAVRFAARLGFTLDAETGAAIGAHARELRGVSRERIGEELRRMFAPGAGRSAAAGMLVELGLDAPVLDEPSRVATVATLAALPDGAAFATCLGAWALDRHAAPAAVLRAGEIDAVARRWRRALCLSNDESEAIRTELEILEMLAGGWLSAGVAPQKRLVARAGFESAMSLLELRRPDLVHPVRARMRELHGIAGGISPEPLLTGDDLVAGGARPGPIFGRVLAAVYDAQLEGRVTNKAEAMELAKRMGV